MPFNWAKVRAYIDGSFFPYRSLDFHPIGLAEHECLMAIPSLQDMCLIREWLQGQISEPYMKFGYFVLNEDEHHRVIARCIGVRFVFDNALDLNYFRLSCHSGHPIYVD